MIRLPSVDCTVQSSDIAPHSLHYQCITSAFKASRHVSCQILASLLSACACLVSLSHTDTSIAKRTYYHFYVHFFWLFIICLVIPQGTVQYIQYKNYLPTCSLYYILHLAVYKNNSLISIVLYSPAEILWALFNFIFCLKLPSNWYRFFQLNK